MYMIVEMVDNKITWNDNKISSSKASANMRMEILKKQAKNRQFQLIQMTKYKVAS